MTTATDETVMDVALFMVLRLHQLLWSTGRSRAIMVTVVWLALGMYVADLSRLYLAFDNPRMFAYVSVTLLYGVMSLVKGFTLVMHADRLRDVLDVAAFSFTTSGQRHADSLRRCRATLSTWLRPYAAMSYSTLAMWLVEPWVQGMASDNNVGPWTVVRATIHAAEMFTFTFNIFSSTQFDCYLLTACSALAVQFRAVAAAFESLGRPLTSDVSEKNTNKDSKNYDELIKYIMENQKILKKLDELYEVVQPVILSQIYIGSYSIVTLIFLTLLEYLTGSSTDMFVAMSKYAMGYALIALQLFMQSFVLDHLEKAKSEVNFGLYSSGWTTMDLKSKKTVLLAMKMNSIHKRVIKVTPNIIINMKLFGEMMKMSYRVASVLINLSSEHVPENGDGGVQKS